MSSTQTHKNDASSLSNKTGPFALALLIGIALFFVLNGVVEMNLLAAVLCSVAVAAIFGAAGSYFMARRPNPENRRILTKKEANAEATAVEDHTTVEANEDHEEA